MGYTELPPAWALWVFIVSPGAACLVTTTVCVILLRSRGAATAMYLWGVAATVALYLLGLPYTALLVYLEDHHGVMLDNDRADVISIVAYTLVFMAVIIGVAVTYRVRRSPR